MGQETLFQGSPTIVKMLAFIFWHSIANGHKQSSRLLSNQHHSAIIPPLVSNHRLKKAKRNNICQLISINIAPVCQFGACICLALRMYPVSDANDRRLVARQTFPKNLQLKWITAQQAYLTKIYYLYQLGSHCFANCAAADIPFEINA